MLIFFVFFLLFLFLGGRLGYLFLGGLAKRKLISLEERVVLGLILGITLLSLFIFLVAHILPIKGAVPVSLAIVTGVLLITSPPEFPRVKRFARIIKAPGPFAVSLLIWTLIFFLLLQKTHLNPSGDSFTGSPSTYGDLPFHLSVITNFAYGENFPPVNPIASSYRLSYHFLADFISSIFVAVSNELRFSLVFPSVVLGVLTVSSLFLLTKRIAKSTSAALLSPLIFLLNGGIGFLKLFIASEEPISRYAHVPELGVEYPNILAEILMAERALLLGIPIFVSVILLIYIWFKTKKTLPLVYAGLFAGLLPYANVYGFLVVGIISVFFFTSSVKTFGLSFQKNPWYLFATLTLVVSLPLFIWVAPQVFTHGSFLRLSFMGWPPLENIWLKLGFWFTNFGLLPILAVISLVKKTYTTPAAKKFLGAIFLLIFLAHVVIFQPYVWDNNRFILYPLIAGSVLSAMVISKVLSKGFYLKILGIVLLVLSILQGLLVVANDPRIEYGLYSQSDFSLADFLKKNTFPHGIFLTGRAHNNPVVSLAGRRVVLGYGGYLWTHGIKDSEEILRDIRAIYGGEESIDKLVEKHRIAYIVVSPLEKIEFPYIKEEVLSSNFSLIYDERGIKIFDTRMNNNEK